MCGVLWDTADQAVAAARGDIELVACTGARCCATWPSTRASSTTRAATTTRCTSPATFQRYADDLARRLVERYGIRNGDVVEIGSGKGDFLRASATWATTAAGATTTTPASRPRRQGHLRRRLLRRHGGRARPGLLAPRARAPGRPGAAVRQRAALGREPTILYVEVPDAAYVLTPAGLWDLIYPHVGYYTPPLRHLVTRSGFEPLEVATSFGDQYLWLEAGRPARRRRRSACPSRPPTRSRPPWRWPTASPSCTARRSPEWADELAEANRTPQRRPVGLGTKGVTFLNVVPGAAEVHAVVDVNPASTGGSSPAPATWRHPDALVADPPDVVLVMNSVYEDEIRSTLAGSAWSTTVTVV